MFRVALQTSVARCLLAAEFSISYERDQRQLSDEMTLLYCWNSYSEEECSADCNILVGKCEGKRRIGRHRRLGLKWMFTK